ncbi:hypothetical protein M9Y10_016542 [Tritrichomonas musculus]|uniref:GRIP domain-containing protein n=1 Tax=Tritrichomonas musculus TaxID=1915356 RepID=A0ABR2HY26_9EUKA
MLNSSDSDNFFAEETISEEKRQLIIENSRLQRSNEQLKIDLNKLQSQFDELVNSCPQISELSKQNSLLTKEVSDLNIKNVELNRRLEISLQTNNDLSEKIISSQSAADSSHSHQISKLNAQINYLKVQHQEEIEKKDKSYQQCQKSLKQTEKDLFLFKSQISKIISLSQNYFKTEISDCNALCSILMNPKEKASLNSSLPIPNNNLKDQTIKTNINSELEKKCEHFKSKYKSEKLKKKQVELSFLQFQKDNDHKDFTINQLKTEIEDLKRNHENTLKQIETSHKQEILSLTTQKPQIKYKSMMVQTTPESLPNHQQTNQFNEAHNSNSSTLESLSDPSSISTINKINNNDINNNSSIAIIEQMKAQIESLIEQLKKAQEKQTKLREKNKSILTKLVKIEKENKTNQKKLSKAAILLQQIQDENEHLNTKLKAGSAALDERNNQAETKLVELLNVQKSLNVLEKVTASQKADIDTVTKERDRLLSLVLFQNQALESFEKYIVNIEKSSSLKSKSKDAYFGNYEEEENNEDNNSSSSFLLSQSGKSINWDFGTLPESIVSILKNFTENEGFSIESKIHHIFNVLSKWFNNLTITHNNEMIELQDKLDESGTKFDNFLAVILNSLGGKESTQEEVVKRVAELNSENAVLLQKVHEYEDIQSIFQEEEDQSKDSSPRLNTVKNLSSQINRLQEKLKDLHSKCHLRKIELKECKAAFIECQKRSDDEIQTLRLANEKARNEINELQNSLNDQHKKCKDLQDELAQTREMHVEEYNKSQEDFESILMQNSSNFDEFQNRTNADLQNKNNKIMALQKQLEEAQSNADHWEQKANFLTEETNSLKTQLDEQIKESEKRFNSLDKQRKDGLKELEKHFNKVHDSLVQRNKELSNQIKELKEPKIVEKNENDEKICSLEEKISQLNYQLQQETARFQSSKETLERQNKLLMVQNNAKLIAMETNYSVKCDELRKDYELKKKELLGFIAHQFRSFYDVKMVLSEETIKSMVKKIKVEITKLRKREDAIRRILNVSEGQSTEDALTELIMSMYPQLVEQTPKTRASK